MGHSARSSLLLVAAAWLASSVPAWALDVEVKAVRTPGRAVNASIELRDVIPDRFKKTLDEGGVLHLRIQAELWEARPVWDRLVYPAIVRVFRFTRGAGRSLSMTDQSGVVTTTQEAPRAMPIDVALGDPSRVAASERYYVHIIATLGTLAEREVDDVGDAVFGRPSETGSLASFGRLVFRTVLQISDYLQSVTAETRSRKLAGADIIRP
ncbi:MAG TPA: hypothetical protein VKE96_33150 [Vicinamibacterales bacterium]|nr:hypothetical protein [Vicinamibacterales bacterium]